MVRVSLYMHRYTVIWTPKRKRLEEYGWVPKRLSKGAINDTLEDFAEESKHGCETWKNFVAGETNYGTRTLEKFTILCTAEYTDRRYINT